MAGSLYMVSAGQTAEPQDINQLVTVLSEPSGQTETGHYFIAFTASVVGALCSCYIPTRSRNLTPVSVSVDVSDGSSGVGAGNPPTTHLSYGGFLVYTYSTGSGTGANVNVGGVYTAQY